MSRQPRNPDEAPKGKAWAVFRMSHVAGGPVKPALLQHRPTFQSRIVAERVAESYDKRLQPSVELIDHRGEAE